MDTDMFVRQTCEWPVCITTKVPKDSPYLNKIGTGGYTNYAKVGTVIFMFKNAIGDDPRDPLEIEFPCRFAAIETIDKWLIAHGIEDYEEMRESILHEAEYLLLFQE